MKTLLFSISLIAILAIGCKTAPTSQQMAGLAELAAYTGASVDLSTSTNHCPIYKSVTAVLDSMDASGNFDPAAFTSALQSLPVKELKDPRAKILIGSTVILWDLYSNQIVSSNQVDRVKPVLNGLDSGLKRALIDYGCK